MVKRVLVSTALEETWPKDGAPIIFLAEWCKLYERNHIWQDLDYEVVPYHWDDRKKISNDYIYLENIYEHLLKILSDQLNKIHNVKFPRCYWRILIGPWLTYFIPIVFDRLSDLLSCLASSLACQPKGSGSIPMLKVVRL